MAAVLRNGFRPKSFFTLILIGFCLVTLPLAGGLINGAVYVDRIFIQSEFAVYRAAQASQVGRALQGQLSDMERNARQYQVLGDKALLQNYVNRHTQFQQTTSQLAELADSPSLKAQISTLREKESALFVLLRESGEETGAKVDDALAEQTFTELSQIAQSIAQESQSWIGSQVALLGDMARNTEKLLIWQTAALVAGTFFFAVVLTVMITRPIRQIDQAIRKLGDGRFDDEIAVKGPRDLQSLGERLNWLRRRLIELEEKKGSFMRHVSHELKTPLTAIREGSALLVEGVLGELNQQQQEVTQVLQRNGLLLQKMIENLLNFNMIQARRTTLTLGDVQLDEVINDVAADHKLAMLAKHIQLKLDCPKISVRGDREKLRVVIDNLLSNAVKYSPDRGRLSVRLRRNGDQVLLDVKDSGPGIDNGDIGKVFEAFYRGKSTPNGDIRGSGLGLSIAKEFIDIHHGTIEVVPESKSGAHFRVVLPAQLEKAVA